MLAACLYERQWISRTVKDVTPAVGGRCDGIFLFEDILKTK